MRSFLFYYTFLQSHFIIKEIYDRERTMPMNWQTPIENFTPTCPQEVADKTLMLNWAKQYGGNALTRENKVAHFTSSAFIFNEDKTKALMVYHNIYKAWSWTGGHMDGDANFLQVAEKEAKEETGIIKLTPLLHSIASLDVLTVVGHMKKGEYVSAHLHLSAAYAFVAPENQALQIAPDENAGVKWMPLKTITEWCTEPEILKVYQKIMKRANNL